MTRDLDLKSHLKVGILNSENKLHERVWYCMSLRNDSCTRSCCQESNLGSSDPKTGTLTTRPYCSPKTSVAQSVLPHLYRPCLSNETLNQEPESILFQCRFLKLNICPTLITSPRNRKAIIFSMRFLLSVVRSSLKMLTSG